MSVHTHTPRLRERPRRVLARRRGRKPQPASEQLLRSISTRIAALKLDLTGLNILTEAATGAYSVTPVIAAMAGAASVHAVGRDTARYGSFQDAKDGVLALAERAGVADRIHVSRRVDRETYASCDIVTNSGHLRPIGKDMIAALPFHAVIALMFEAWEFRDGDLDLNACRERDIPVVAVNEQHPDVGVFEFLGPLCVRLLDDADIDTRGADIGVICDNPFAPFLERGLLAAGANVSMVSSVEALPDGSRDAVVLAINPAWHAPLGANALAMLAQRAPDTPLVQFWGDVDRSAKPSGIKRIWPWREPAPGHMAILLNALGPEPIVRLQAGGLRAAQVVRRGEPLVPGGVAELL